MSIRPYLVRVAGDQPVPRRLKTRRSTAMRRIIVVENVTLDGVIQGPGDPDEDRRGGFARGGWAAPYSDPVMLGEMGKDMGRTDLLFGRWTYQKMYAAWHGNPEPNPFTEVLDNAHKYVVSTTLTEPLEWVNATLLNGDAGVSVAKLKEQPGKDLVVLGSGALVRALIRHDLVDEYQLLIHPLVLGSGRKLFDDGQYAKLRLTNSVTTTTGVVIATYQPE
jgi:dihydrofolate reductase